MYPERATDSLQRWHQRQEAHVRTEEILQDRDLRTLRKQVRYRYCTVPDIEICADVTAWERICRFGVNHCFQA